jgi:hypothetical protein
MTNNKKYDGSGGNYLVRFSFETGRVVLGMCVLLVMLCIGGFASMTIAKSQSAANRGVYMGVCTVCLMLIAAVTTFVLATPKGMRMSLYPPLQAMFQAVIDAEIDKAKAPGGPEKMVPSLLSRMYGRRV